MDQFETLKRILNFIYISAIQTLILKLSIKCLLVSSDCKDIFCAVYKYIESLMVKFTSVLDKPTRADIL